MRPATVNVGHLATTAKVGGGLVSRLVLAGQLQVLVQTRMLAVASACPKQKRLAQFQVKPITNTDDPLAAWRDGPHDDLVLAVAVGAWEAEHRLEVWVRC